MPSIVCSSSAAQRFSGDDLVALLVQTRETDAQDGLTGLIVHRDGRSLQLIEGPRSPCARG